MAVYIPVLQDPIRNEQLLDIRIAADPNSVTSGARKVLKSLGLHYPVRIEMLDQRKDRILADQDVIAMLSGYFGILALLLACIGIYGIMSYTVTRRTSELGIRMALGAQRSDVMRLVLVEVMWLVIAGIAVGIPIALAASRLVAGMLFGLHVNDPVTMALSAAILVGAGLLAAYFPARRASGIDPMSALRLE